MQIEEVFRKLKTDPWAEDTTIKEEILNKFREIGQPVIEKIIEMSKSDWGKTRQEAYKRLGGLGAIEALWLLEDERGEDLLIQALKDEAEVIRGEAVHSLILIEEVKKTGKAIPAIIDVLRNEKNPNFRADTALGLAFIKWDQRVTDALIEALNDTELTWSESLLTGTQYGVSVATMATEALAKQGNKRGIEAIAPRILEGMWTVEHTMEVFRYMGPPAIEYLVPGLKMEKWISRERAAASLGEIGDAQSTDALIAALGDEHWKVRRRAAEALGKIKDTTAIEPLSKALDDESGDVQNKARDALVRIGGPAVIALIQALKHEDANVRQRAAFALGDIGSAKALDALTEAKEDKSGWVRNAVKGAIKKIQKK